MALAPSPRGRGSKGKGSSGEQNRLSPSGGKARWGARAAGMLGTAQHRQDAGRAGTVLALALPDSPSQQHLQPSPGTEHKGPKVAPKAGTVRGVPAQAVGCAMGTGSGGAQPDAPRCQGSYPLQAAAVGWAGSGQQQLRPGHYCCRRARVEADRPRGGGRELGHNELSLGRSSARAEGGRGRGML